MKRRAFAIVLITAAIATQASAQTEDEQKSVNRLYAGIRYFLTKAEPDKARRYAQSMYMMLRDKEIQYGSNYADDLFYRATGIAGSRKTFFRSMEVIESDGSLSSIPKEPEKKSFTCRRQSDDSVRCVEN